MTDEQPLYTSESYASAYAPEQSIYPEDGRIFHRAHYTYAVVKMLAEARIENGEFQARALLSDGTEAVLTVTAYARNTFRVRLTERPTPPPAASPMLTPLTAPLRPLWEDCAPSEQTNGQPFALKMNGYTLKITCQPFSMTATNPEGEAIFALETEQVAGDWITPPMGFRRSAGNAGSQAFFSWRMQNDERFFGLGEKWNKVEKTSTRATIWSADTCGTNTCDLSYKSIPMIHSTRGWGAMIHSSFRSFWEVGSFSYTSGSALIEEAQLDLFLYFAPTLKGLIERYTALTGRPSFPPQWAFGVWMSRCAYRTRQEVEGVLARLDREAIPFDVIHLDAWLKNHYYVRLGVDACDFEWDEERWPQTEEMLAGWRAAGVHTSLWINPYIPEEHPLYAFAAERGYLVKSTQGGWARLERAQPVGIVDFTHPEARAWWQGRITEQLKRGAAVVKPDYGDSVPADALFFNGKTGAEMHNLYLHLYAEAAFEAVRAATGDGIVWRRAGYLGTQRFPGTWAGDTQTTWQGLRGALRGGISAGFGGEAFWSHDIGGFVGEQPSPELYIRWVQFGMFSPFTRFHGTTPREPWAYGEAALEIVRHYAQLRYSLAPYLFAYGYEATQTGLPILRALALEFPNEPNIDTIEDEYMLGADLLVAPVLVEGARGRWVYFPEGKWYALEGGQVYTGGRYQRVAAPLERIPVFVRAGAVIPRYTHHPRRLGDAAPKAMALDVYPPEGEQSTGRRLIIPENGRTLTLEWKAGTLRVFPAEVMLHVASIADSAARKPVQTLDARDGVECTF